MATLGSAHMFGWGAFCSFAGKALHRNLPQRRTLTHPQNVSSSTSASSMISQQAWMEPFAHRTGWMHVPVCEVLSMSSESQQKNITKATEKLKA